MAVFHRILFTTDFSETSIYAAEFAVLMSKKFSAALHVLHVLESELPMMIDGMPYFPQAVLDEVEKHAAEQLDEVIAREDRDKLSVTLSLRRGPAFLEIIRYARDQKMDLIVMGTHGRGMLAHVLMGNIAEKVVRKAPCPVLTVRHPQHQAVMP